MSARFRQPFRLRLQAPRLRPVQALAALLLAPVLAAAAPIQVTHGVGNNASLSWSHDGQRLVFASSQNLDGSNADGSWEVYSHNRASGVSSALTVSSGSPLFNGSQTPRLSADGRTVVYQTFAPARGSSLAFRSFVDAGAGAVPLTGFGDFAIGDLSGDGRQVLLNSSNDGLRLFDLATGGNRLLAGGFTLNFALSGDGSRVARSGLQGEVQLIDVATGATRQIAAGTGSVFDADLALSADGLRLAFVSPLDLLGHNGDGNAELYLMDLASGVLRQLTDSTEGGVLRGPSLDADGSRLVFSSLRDLSGRNADHGEEVFMLDLVSHQVLQLSDSASGTDYATEATISGDGLSAAWAGGNVLLGGTQVFLEALAPRDSRVPEPGGLVPLALAAALMVRGRARRRRG